MRPYFDSTRSIAPLAKFFQFWSIKLLSCPHFWETVSEILFLVDGQTACHIYILKHVLIIEKRATELTMGLFMFQLSVQPFIGGIMEVSSELNNRKVRSLSRQYYRLSSNQIQYVVHWSKNSVTHCLGILKIFIYMWSLIEHKIQYSM